uniref:Uncharacterized protein n=1 Tax=Neovison vison TaxID=452646 RepID=A0A8C7BKD9_NEOVI
IYFHSTSLLLLTLTLRARSASLPGVLPRPSIWAEPGPVIPRGQPVTIVCQGPAGVEIFHLEKEGRRSYQCVRNPLPETQARFLIPTASEDAARLYRHIYYKGVSWSEHSQQLHLEVTGRWQGPGSSGWT